VIGKRIADCGLRIADYKSRRRDSLSPIPQSAIRNPQSKGFTLLELMIVISILVILAMIGIAQYQKTVLAAKEATLRENLFQMRKMLDQYAADKGKLPDSLDQLKEAGYVREIPVDPLTNEADWNTELGEDPNSTEGGQGIINVHSSSSETASDGSRYSDW
jgi:general secretion pathway protein G